MSHSNKYLHQLFFYPFLFPAEPKTLFNLFSIAFEIVSNSTLPASAFLFCAKIYSGIGETPWSAVKTIKQFLVQYIYLNK